MIRFLVLVLVVLVGVKAEACDRCGLRNCRFKQQVVVPQVQQVVVPQVIEQAVAVPYAPPQQVLNITNVYPQGSTVYSVGQVAPLYSANPDLALQLTAKIVDNGIGSLKAAIEAGNTNNQALLNLATVQAATEHLRTATTAQMNAGTQSLNLRITQGASGIKVEQINEPMEPSAEKPMQEVASNGLLKAKCAQCHGQELTQPKGGLFLDSGLGLDAKTALRAVSVVNGRNVPSSMTGVIEGLTPEEKQGLVDEILALWKQEE